MSPWYSRQREDESPRFWLQFQVCSDGLGHDIKDTEDYASSSFHHFPHLPPELRLQIWKSLIQPRVVIAACISPGLAKHKAAQLARRPRRPTVPVLLHVCRETRALALQHYEMAFSWKVPQGLSPSPADSAAADRGDARIWFNFARDALLLLGELEPLDRWGFSSPMVYFLRREDTRRVRHVACALEELRLGGSGSSDGGGGGAFSSPAVSEEHVFGCLFHVVDRFPGAKRLLISCTPWDTDGTRRNLVLPAHDNVVQKLWSAWINGTSVATSSLSDTQILMVREEDLSSFIARQ